MIVLFAHRQRTTIAVTAISVALAAFACMAAGDCTWQGAWLWSGKRNEPAAHRHFRKTFSADPATLRLAAFQCASDDWADIFLNGKKIGQSRSWARHLYLNGREEPLILYRGAINERGTATYGRFMAGFDEACVRLAEVSLPPRRSRASGHPVRRAWT